MSRCHGTFGILLAGALALSAVAASPALAGKTTANCWVTPNPVTNAATYAVSGWGFPAGMIVTLYISDRVSTWIIYGGYVTGGTVGADGTFSIGGLSSAIYYPSDLGKKTVKVVNALDTRTKTRCQCSFSVQ